MLIDHKENGDRLAELMMIKFEESGHPVFRAMSSISSVSTEQSQICVMNTGPVKQERRASLLMKTPTPSTEVPAQEDLLQKYQERVEKALTTKSCDKDVY